MGSTHPSFDDEQNREEHLESFGLVFGGYYSTAFPACIAVFENIFFCFQAKSFLFFLPEKTNPHSAQSIISPPAAQYTTR